MADTLASTKRTLTPAGLKELRELLAVARRPPLLPSPPPSPPQTFTKLDPPAKRKHAEISDASNSESSSPAKRPRTEPSYSVPPRIRPSKPLQPNPAKFNELGRKYKHIGDKYDKQGETTLGAHYYAISILNFAFHFRLICVTGTPKNPWGSMKGMWDVHNRRMQSALRKVPEPKAKAWEAYWELFKQAVNVQDDREEAKNLRMEIWTQLNSSQSSQRTEITTPPAKSPPTVPSPPGDAPTPNREAGKSSPPVASSLDAGKANKAADMMQRLRRGTNPVDIRRKVGMHLNPVVLKEHFPRTYARAFGPDGLGHPGSGALQSWEDYWVADFEEEEAKGGDFPYPHSAEDIVWVVLLGRSMLAELGFKPSVDAGPIAK